jgi:hypothetical protein
VQNCEHASVIVGGGGDLKLAEDAADVRLHRLGAEPELLTDGSIRASLGHAGSGCPVLGVTRTSAPSTKA